VALGNSATSTPGFPGATLVGALQAFADAEKKEKHMPTTDEIKELVKQGKIKPSDLFSAEDIENDAKSKRILDIAHHDATGQIIRLHNELDQLREQMTQLTGKHADEVQRLKGEAVRATFQPTLTALITERKMPDKQTAFVNLRLKTFKSEAEDEAGLKSDMNKFIDAAQAEYIDFLKSQGIDPMTVLGKTEDGKREDKGEGKPPEKKAFVDLEANLYKGLDSAKTNPLLAPVTD
jgi:hypothetical protein